METAVETKVMIDSSSSGVVSVDGGYSTDYNTTGSEGIDTGEMIDGTLVDSTVKDPILSSWLFVGGITVVTLAISIFLGILLAKKRIKKGYDLYEI